MKQKLKFLPLPKTAPLYVYETQYIYTGFRRVDTHRKCVVEITEDYTGQWWYEEFPWKEGVLSRNYHTELVRVAVYSETPRIWSEAIGPKEPTQVFSLETTSRG